MFKNWLISSLLFLSMSFTTHLVHAQSSTVIPVQQFNQVLHDQLPEHILNSGELVVVNDGTVPPFIIYLEDNNMVGANLDLLNALSEVLGVKIKHERVGGIPALLTGVKSARYDMAIGPIADSVERQKNNDFIDYVREYAALAVFRGNPQQINSLSDICGKRIAVQAGGTAEKRLIIQSEKCVEQGKAAVTIQSFKDQTTPLIALKSERADAFYSGAAVLAYYISLANDELELVGIGLKSDFPYPKTYQGAVVAKDSPLGPVILQALQLLFDNGTYELIMKKWGLVGNMLDAPSINLVK